jgi:hypothetical protein
MQQKQQAESPLINYKKEDFGSREEQSNDFRGPNFL